ncbi:MAG: glycosyltransferase [Salinivirgaceae bacterium]|nr:glycosyltransferase [Salinivirgaceae bacterium]
MKLSIIIVNYNVKYFLEQCLHSVYKAIHNVEAEIFVVDNNSVDGSCAMMHKKFPNVHLIENKENTGFAVANNQAMRIAKGEYFLLLNPDTVVEENTFEKVVQFMDAHSDAGGLGVKMIDGKGIFLPESKRGLPTPMVAFYKIFGLSKIFPKSKRFSKYHLGYLSNDQVHEIEVLAGAFMLMRKETLDKVGLLDEDYFMYGEDIDLSYRITKGGYKNYYFPETTIIHYKGESTKKGSINYVKVFYNAMIIFARKHFSSKNARLFSFFINMAIYFRAFIAIINRVAKRLFLPILDALILFLGFWVITPKWSIYKFNDIDHFPLEYFALAVPVYILIWLTSVFLSGGYDKPVRIGKISRGLFIGTGLILVLYALLPEYFRFSRAMIFLGFLWGILLILVSRISFHLLGIKGYKFDFGKKSRIAMLGEKNESERVLQIINQSNNNFEYVGLINYQEETKSDDYIGSINQLKEIIQINKIDELIFCASNLPSQRIIKEMLRLEGLQVAYKIAPPESLSIIGSNSIDTAGDLYTVDFNNITKQHNLRNKRLFDLSFSIIFMVLSPVFLLFVSNRYQFIKNIFSVLFGMKSWVGFYLRNDINTLNLPRIKVGVFSWISVNNKEGEKAEMIEKHNLIYAKNYKILNDINILSKGIKKLSKT